MLPLSVCFDVDQRQQSWFGFFVYIIEGFSGLAPPRLPAWALPSDSLHGGPKFTFSYVIVGFPKPFKGNFRLAFQLGHALLPFYKEIQNSLFPE